MTDLFRLMGSIGVDTDEAERGMDRVRGEGEKTEKSLGKSFSGALGKVGGALGKIGMAAGVTTAALAAVGAVAVGSIVKAGVSYNAQMQNFEAGFTSLLGSAEAAKGMLADLSSFAAATPFEMPQLADASTTLLQFGIASDQVQGSLQMLGDISMGNGEKLESLTRVFGQVSSAGKLTMEDVNQMIDAGFNPLQGIAAKTGESMSDLRTRVSAGKVSFDELKTAMQDATGPGGQFFQAMQNGSKTLTGQLSTLQDGFNILSGSVTNGLTTALTNDLLPGLNGVVSGLVGMMNGTEGAQEAVDAAVDQLVTGIQNIGPVLLTMVDNIGRIFVALAPALDEALPLLFQAVFAMLPMILQLGGNIVLSLIDGLLAALPDLVAAAVPILVTLVGALAGMLPDIVAAGVDVLLALVQGIADALPNVIPAVVDGIVRALLELFNEDTLHAIVLGALALITGLAKGLLDALPTLIDAIPEIIIALVSTLLEAIPELIDAGVKLLVSIVEALPDIINQIVAVLPGIVTALVEALTNPAMTTQLTLAGVLLLVALVKNLPAILKGTLSVIPAIVKGIVGAFTDPAQVQRVAQAGTQLLNGLSSAFSGPLAKAKSAVKSAIDAIVGFFNRKITWPHIPLPHFSISPRGWDVGDLLRGSIPHLGIDWYAQGGVLNKPTVFGAMDGRLMAGGEAGPEAVAPIDVLQGYVTDAVSAARGRTDDLLEQMLTVLTEYLPNVGGDVVLDGRIVGALGPGMNQSLGRETLTRGRGAPSGVGAAWGW